MTQEHNILEWYAATLECAIYQDMRWCQLSKH